MKVSVTRFWSFCLNLSVSNSPSKCIIILLNISAIIVTTEIPAKNFGVVHLGCQMKLVLVLTTQVNVKRALNQMCSTTEKPRLLKCLQK